MNVAWVLQQVPEQFATPELIYELYRRHRLVPESVPLALNGFHAMSTNGEVFEVVSDGTAVATVIVSGLIPNERADVDVIPVGKFFRGGYEQSLASAMHPIWEYTFEKYQVRRLTSAVPASRTRTVKALRSLGFKIEGVMREAAKIIDKEPEDLILLGLLPTDLEE